MEITRADTSDCGGILDLQSRYLIDNLSLEERRGGFLSAEFTQGQIAAMAADLGIMVCREGKEVVGYACASRLEFSPRPPILDSLFHCLENAVFQDKPLMKAPVFVYGPACIDRDYRGTGLLGRMFSMFKKDLGDPFEFGVCFVAVENEHSLGAHTKGLGMTQVALFEHAGNYYHALAFAVR